MKKNIEKETASMKPRTKQAVLGIIAIVIAIAIGVIIYPMIMQSRVEEVNVVTAAVDVEKNTVITEEMLSVKSVPKAYAEEAISEKTSVIGKHAVAHMFAGDIFTAEKVTNTITEIENNDMEKATAAGYRVVSVTLPDLASSVSGQIRSGDVVSIMNAMPMSVVSNEIKTETVSNVPTPTQENRYEEEQPEEKTEGTFMDGNIDVQGFYYDAPAAVEEKGDIIIEELKYVEVCSISRSDGSDYEQFSITEDAAASIPATISFYVTEEQAEKLLEIEQTGKIHIVFVARGDERNSFSDNLVK